MGVNKIYRVAFEPHDSMKLRNAVVKSLYYVTYTLYSVLLPQLPTLFRLQR